MFDIIVMPDHDGDKRTHLRLCKNGKKPYTQPNPYEVYDYHERDGLHRYDVPQLGWVAGQPVYTNRTSMCSSFIDDYSRPDLARMTTRVHNKALNKLNDELTVASNLFETWYERQQAYALLFDAGKEVLDFLINWKKPKYWKRKASSISPSTLPAAWLTWQFGVKPLIGTIDTCMQGLAQPLPAAKFKAIATSDYKLLRAHYDINVDGKYTLILGCDAIPNANPNVALSNIAGITTPFSTAWSVIPWGWAVDYFVNVSELLSNVEVVHPGITTSNHYQTKVWDFTWSGYVEDKYNFGKPKKYAYFDGEGKTMIRSLTGKPNYKLELKFPLLGSNKVANLFSAIALTMKGRK